MARQAKTGLPEAAYAALLEHGLDGTGEALRLLVNEAARIERSECIVTCPYERSQVRRDDANSFKPKAMLTRLEEVIFQAPQVRSGDFNPSTLEKSTRTDQAVALALAEMYVHCPGRNQR